MSPRMSVVLRLRNTALEFLQNYNQCVQNQNSNHNSWSCLYSTSCVPDGIPRELQSSSCSQEVPATTTPFADQAKESPSYLFKFSHSSDRAAESLVLLSSISNQLLKSELFKRQQQIASDIISRATLLKCYSKHYATSVERIIVILARIPFLTLVG